MTGRTSATAGFKKGDKVWVPLAVGRVRGAVIEDRGPLGLEGRHVYRVSVPNDPYVSEEYTLSEDELTLLDEREEQSEHEQPAPNAIMEFLVDGGLIAILQTNGPERVWLRRDASGNLTFTFMEGYSATGGHVPPAYALHGERIFSPKEREVSEFIQSFGLSEEQAEHIVSSIGKAP